MLQIVFKLEITLVNNKNKYTNIYEIYFFSKNS